MTLSHGWSMPEQHLLPDAIVAFVDGELAEAPARRAEAHLRRCASCSAEAAAQRQASGAVRSASVPHAPAGLLSSLREIPSDVELPAMPDGLAVAPDGQLVMAQRPQKQRKSRADSAPLASSGPVIGSSAPLGAAGLGDGALGAADRHASRRAAQGAGVVVSGLVLGALALTLPQLQGPVSGGSESGSSVPARRPAGVQVARAELGGGAVHTADRRSGQQQSSPDPSTSVSVPAPAGR